MVLGVHLATPLADIFPALKVKAVTLAAVALVLIVITPVVALMLEMVELPALNLDGMLNDIPVPTVRPVTDPIAVRTPEVLVPVVVTDILLKVNVTEPVAKAVWFRVNFLLAESTELIVPLGTMDVSLET